MNVALFVNDRGEVCLTHDAPLPQPAEALLVDQARGRCALLLARRRRQILDTDIDPALRPAVYAAKTVLLVHLHDGAPRAAVEVPVVLR